MSKPQTEEEFDQELEDLMCEPMSEDDIEWIKSLGTRLPSPIESHWRFAHPGENPRDVCCMFNPECPGCGCTIEKLEISEGFKNE